MRAWVGLAFVVFYHIQVDKSNPSAEKITKNTHTHTAVAVGSREADLRSRGRKHAHVKKPNFFASVFIFLHSQASLLFSFFFFFFFFFFFLRKMSAVDKTFLFTHFLIPFSVVVERITTLLLYCGFVA